MIEQVNALKHGVARPRYLQIADRLRERILSGELAGGQRLEGEFELARGLGVSRPTVRSALALLQREGLVVTRQGLGSFVSPPRMHQTLGGVETLDSTIAEQAHSSETEVLEYTFAAPSQAARTALRLPPDSNVLFVRRIYRAQGEPIAVVAVSIVPDVGAGLSRRDVEEHGLYYLLPAHLGINIDLATQSVRAGSAKRQTALALQVGDGAPILECERVTYTESGRPVIHALFSYRGDRFEFRVTLAARTLKVPWSSPGLTRLQAEDSSGE